MNKVALVTGASSVFGKLVVQELTTSGFKVFAATKQVNQMEDLKADGITPLYMDLTENRSIQTCVDRVLSESGCIDVLVNNVNYGSYGAVECFPIEEVRRQFDVNVFGMARVIQLVTPSMRAKRTGKIVNVSFMNGMVWTEMGVWYHSLKQAVDGFFDSLRSELEPFGIDVMTVEPGDIKKEWERIVADTLERVSVPGPYANMAESVAERIKRFKSDYKLRDPQRVAKMVCKAINSRNPDDRYVVTKSWSKMWLYDIIEDFFYMIAEDFYL